MSPDGTASRHVNAVAARDHKEIVGTLAPEVSFRYLIPPGPGQAVGAANAADTYLSWFGDAEQLEVQNVLVRQVSDRHSVRYRFLVSRHAAWEVIEQHSFLDVDAEGRITTIDLLCSGFRPAPIGQGGHSMQTHEFDAGSMGCSDGLAPEFRRRMGAIAVGDALVVTARDPAAKEDLPSLARMMGHTVRSVESASDGRLLITVERGR
jgi:TusA-related sulfurtransferase